MSSSSSSTEDDLAIVGCGVLGSLLCQRILSNQDGYKITGITKTTNNHETIMESVNQNENLTLTTEENIYKSKQKFKNVVFCAPPSGSEDYPATVKKAVEELWQGAENGGTFVFTSSSAVYALNNKETITEKTPTADESTASPRVARLVNAEKAVLKCNGCVLRLAGLYTRSRGAHNYYLTKGSIIPSNSQGVLNLLHYEDAAGACYATLFTKAYDADINGKAFIISDNHPMTRQEICQACLDSELYKNKSMPEFDDTKEDLGKILDGSKSNEILGWTPEYTSFRDFFSS